MLADDAVRIHIEPEDPGPINDSPWYAFKVIPGKATRARIEIEYHGGSHRYWPKISLDGKTWRRLEETNLEVTTVESAEVVEPAENPAEPPKPEIISSEAVISLDLGQSPVWVSAQELILPGDVADWIQQTVAKGAVASLLGTSVQGAPIEKLDINESASEVVFLASRQHPPEVTGAIGFTAFYEALLADTPTANAFRNRFHIVAIPMLNPDGVSAGHWRHNADGKDLNRDWGTFSQPETSLVAALLDQLDAQGKQIRICVDFHSTANNLMYTQDAASVTSPPDFAANWIAASMARLDGLDFANEPRPVSELETSRNYMYLRYGIPAVTYEVADEEDRDNIRRMAAVFADEMMKMLLEAQP